MPGHREDTDSVPQVCFFPLQVKETRILNVEQSRRVALPLDYTCVPVCVCERAYVLTWLRSTGSGGQESD